MKKWQMQTLFYPDGWEATNDELFDTKEEAEAELKSHIYDMEEAVELGYMTDCQADAWRIAEVEVEQP
jgi:hypothetical protein